MKKNNSIELSRHIHSFLYNYAPSQLTSSEHTLRSYETAMTLYIGYLESECSITPDKFSAECFNQEHIEGWLKWLSEERECSISTCNNRLSAIKAFIHYLSTRDIQYIAINTEAHAVHYKKTVKKKVVGLSRNAVKAIIAAPDVKKGSGLRDVTLMIVLYGTAARIGELLSIKLQDLHLESAKPYVNIIGKGGKIRTLYLLPKAVGFLKLYLKKYHDSDSDENDYLFYSVIHGKTHALSQQAVYKILRKYAAVAHEKCSDVPIDLHAHQFRHAKASHWLEDGMNIVQISFLLGHSSVETTMVYLDITTEQETAALATLQSEKNQKVSPKWNSKKDTLSNLCGLRRIKEKK